MDRNKLHSALKPLGPFAAILLLVSCASLPPLELQFAAPRTAAASLLSANVFPSKIDGGNLAWKESYFVQALLIEWEATQEFSLLEEAAKRARRFLDSTDEKLGRTDWLGRSGPVWSSIHYHEGTERIAYVVHTGMITYPLAWLAKVLTQVPAFPGGPDLRDELIRVCRAAVDFHEQEFQSRAGGAGAYCYPAEAEFLADRGRVLPNNMQHALGRTMILLDRLLPDHPYDRRVRTLASNFVSLVSWGASAQGENVHWSYWPDDATATGEDLSHAAISADFLRLCSEDDLGVSRSQAKAVADTIAQSLSSSLFQVDGALGGGGNSSFERALGFWGGFGTIQPAVVTLALNILSKAKALAASPNDLVARAWSTHLPVGIPEDTKLLQWSLPNVAGRVLLRYRASTPVEIWWTEDRALPPTRYRLPATSSFLTESSPWIDAWVPVPSFTPDQAEPRTVHLSTGPGNYAIEASSRPKVRP